MTVLVTGGAGYIGSHMVLELLDRGERCVVLDNLSTGLSEAVPQQVPLIVGNVADVALVQSVIGEHAVDAIIHFAGSIVVPDSVRDPLSYYANNTVASRALIEAAVAAGVQHFIFSSTAAIYGDGSDKPLDEDAHKAPANPYGRSKLMTEWMLEDTARAYSGFRYGALRYFNVAGADAAGRAGQSTPQATHLIKRACQAALGHIEALDIFGTDYPTPDGTGVRDYIHVSDLAAAHSLMLDALREGKTYGAYNCGYGHGLSVREIIAGVEAVTGRPLPVRNAPRRAGDPAMLIADPAKLKRDLAWTPRQDDLKTIIASAYAWERRRNR